MRLYVILLFLLCCSLSIAQQRVTLSGKIIDGQTGKGIGGATVRLMLADQVYTADEGGLYSLTIERANRFDTLLVSYLSYEKHRIPVRLLESQVNNIRLYPIAQELEEVVINTGYQVQQKRTATGSVEVIGEEQLRYGFSSNIMDRIEGLISGSVTDRTNFNFNGVSQQPDLTIRGVSSIYAETFPLIVVDNFPYEGALDQINPDDIESVTVLKDAAAAAIWGVKAGNGVIVVTTKKGRLNQALTVDISANTTFGRKPDLFKELIASSADFVDMELFLFNEGFYNSQINNVRKPPLSPVISLLAQHRRGEVSEQELEGQLEAFRQRDVRSDYLKHVYRSPIERNLSLSMRGGGNKTTYTVTVGYNGNNYTMPMNHQHRFTGRYNQSYRLLSNLSISADMAYTFLKSNQYNSGNMVGYDQLFINGKRLYPYAQLKDELGNNSAVYKDYDKSFIDENQSFVMKDWTFRPLDEINNHGNRTEKDQIIAGLNLDYEPLAGVRLSINSQLNRASSESNSYYEPDSYFTRNLFNRYTYVSADIIEHNMPEGGIQDKGHVKTWGYAMRGQLLLDKKIANKHQLQGLFGAEIREVNNGSDMGRLYGVINDKNIYSLVDFTTTKRLYPVLGSRSYLPNNIGMGQSTDRFISFYSNMNYSFHDRYFLSLSGRNDASNIFGVDIRNKWSPLWSVGAGWEVSREPFFNPNIFNYLKVRTTFGYSGNVNSKIPAELVLERASYRDFYTNQPFNYIVSLKNPGLRWEKIETLNFGIDGRMFGNQLTYSVDYYRKISKDLMSAAVVDPTFGVVSEIMNAAKLSGKGIDVNLSYNMQKGVWGWTPMLRAGYNKSILRAYYAPQQTVTSNAMVFADFVGKEYKTLTSLKWYGLNEDTGAPVGYFNNELSTDYLSIVQDTPLEELNYHGSSIPKATLLFRNAVRYKNFELGVTLSGQFLYYFRKSSIDYGTFFNRWIGHADFANRWKAPGDELQTTVPAFNYPLDANRDAFYSLSEVLVRRGDHLRLQDVRISYNLKPKNGKFTVKSMEIFALASNLGLVWTKNSEGVDPVYNMGIGPNLSISAGLRVEL